MNMTPEQQARFDKAAEELREAFVRLAEAAQTAIEDSLIATADEIRGRRDIERIMAEQRDPEAFHKGMEDAKNLRCTDCRGTGLVKNMLDEDEMCGECYGTGKATR